MSDELKPCPFCGSKAILDETNEYEVFVGCYNCYAHTGLYCYKQDAIDVWNSRVETSPFKKKEINFIIKVLLHDSVAKQTVDIMRINIIRKCQKLIKDSPFELLSVDKNALDRLLKRGEND